MICIINLFSLLHKRKPIHNFKNEHYTYKSQPTKTNSIIEYSIVLNEQQHLCTFRQQQSVMLYSSSLGTEVASALGNVVRLKLGLPVCRPIDEPRRPPPIVCGPQ